MPTFERHAAKTSALACVLALVVPGTVRAAEDLIAAVPRSGSVDVPLSLGQPWQTLRPLSMTAAAGPRRFVTRHSGTFNGKKVTYQATVAETLVSQNGKVLASLFNTSYVAQTKGSGTDRPVVFLFNGGPGGSSAPLHLLGAWGARKLKSSLVKDIDDPNNVIVDNPDSPLDAMDLVFVDAADTGYSRSAPGAGDALHSVDTDSESLSQFVVQWLRDNGRLGSPVYIGGESYGSMRVIAMTRDVLRIEPKLNVPGLMIMGPAPTFGQNGRTPNPLFIASKAPMMASIAYHYGKIDNKTQTWAQAVQKASDFGRKEWLPALVAGHDLGQAEFDRIIATLPSIIGIPEDYFRRNRTISVANFNAELLRSEGLVVDRNNGLETSKAGGEPNYKALGEKVGRYFTSELGVTDLGDYWYVTGLTLFPWNFETTGAPALDVTLANLLKDNPKMRVIVVQGRQDTLTDLGTAQYVMAQTDLPRDRYSFRYYDGGHLTLNTLESRAALRDFVLGR